MRRNLGLVGLLVVSACSGSTTDGDCGGEGECPAGSVCIADSCRVVCNAASDCPDGQICTGGACFPGDPSVAPPIITEIDGTGSIDTTTDHTPRHLTNRLVIVGNHLDASTAYLSRAGSAPVELEACEPVSETRMVVGLPADLTEGQYYLSAVNQGGACEVSVNILQGEPGSLDASGSEIVVSINQAMELDPSLRLQGSLHGRVSTLVGISSRATAAERSIFVDGIDEVDAATSGLYISVFDLATHTVVNETLGAGITTKMAVDVSNAVQRDALNQVLDWLDEDHAIVLASTGDISAIAGDAELVARLKSLGASSVIDTLGASDAWVLVGKTGTGAGGGLESWSDGGVARVATAVVDGILLGSGKSLPFAASTTPAGPAVSALDLECSTCVDGGEIAAGQIGLVHLADTGCGSGQTLKWNGSGWACADDADTDTNCTWGATGTWWSGCGRIPGVCECGTATGFQLRTRDLNCGGTSVTIAQMRSCTFSDSCGCP